MVRYVDYRYNGGSIKLPSAIAKECRRYGISGESIVKKYSEYLELNVPVLNYGEAANSLIFYRKKNNGGLL